MRMQRRQNFKLSLRHYKNWKSQYFGKKSAGNSQSPCRMPRWSVPILPSGSFWLRYMRCTSCPFYFRTHSRVKSLGNNEIFKTKESSGLGFYQLAIIKLPQKCNQSQDNQTHALQYFPGTWKFAEIIMVQNLEHTRSTPLLGIQSVAVLSPAKSLKNYRSWTVVEDKKLILDLQFGTRLRSRFICGWKLRHAIENKKF